MSTDMQIYIDELLEYKEASESKSIKIYNLEQRIEQLEANKKSIEEDRLALAIKYNNQIKQIEQFKCSDLSGENKRLRAILQKWKDACDGKVVMHPTAKNGYWLMDLMWENTKASEEK